ncbi:MAG: NTP transferase domain-containing protein [Candidatus Zixiibacteriota bacterium]|nr:MAG: NTP transferase domain-containing protein [candidate division Zixibacteria bacterium]
MEAVILAGGKGTRLRPYTSDMPKALVPVGHRPVVEILLRQLRKAGVTKARLAVGHMAHLIEAALGNGSRLDLEISYSREEQPLSTIGPLKLLSDLPDDFLVINADILSDIDIDELFRNHLESGAGLTVAVHRRYETIDYGVLESDGDNRAVSFAEKPQYSFLVSMGIYVVSRAVLDLVPQGQPFGFDALMRLLLQREEKINTYSYDGYWLDIGRPADYDQAQADVELIESWLK